MWRATAMTPGPTAVRSQVDDPLLTSSKRRLGAHGLAWKMIGNSRLGALRSLLAGPQGRVGVQGPAGPRNLGERPQAVGDVLVAQVLRRRQVSRELPQELWRDVAHRCEHADAAVLDLGLSATRKRLRITVLREAC